MLIGLLVVMCVVVVLVLLLFSFPVDGVVGACPFVLCSLLLLSGLVCVLSSSASMKLDHVCSVVTV